MKIRSSSRIMSALVALVLVGLVVGCGSASKPAPAPAPAPSPAAPAPAPAPAPLNKVVIAIKGDPSGLDAQKNDDGNMRYVTESIYEALVTRDGQTLEIKPALAESCKQADPTTVDCKLRAGVKFHNGDALTADDVVWSVKRQISKELNSDIGSFFGTIKDAVKVDDSTVRITTTGVDPSIMNRIALLKIYSKKFFDGKDNAFVQTNANGTGPYTLVKWTKGVSTELKANPNYWGTKPKVENVVIRPIEADATRLAGLQTGEIDLATDMPPQLVPQLPVSATAPSLEYSLILINRFRGAFTNPKLAEAAVRAVDRSALATKLFGGLADTYDLLPFKSASVGFSPAKAFTYDPEKAKALLKEANYDGKPIQLVGENGRFQKDGESTQAVAQMLEAVGFKVEVKMVSFQDWLKVIFGRELSSDLMYLSHSNDIFDADRTYSNYVLTSGSGSKYTDKLNGKVDAARNEADPAKRKALYDEIANTLATDPGWIPLVNVKNIYGLSKKIDWKPRLDQNVLPTEISPKA